MPHRDPARRFFFVLLLAAALLVALLVRPIASALFLAAALAGVTWPVYSVLNRYLKQRRGLSAGLLVLAVVVLVLAPVAAFSAFAVSEAAGGYRFLADTVRGAGVRGLVERLPPTLSRLILAPLAHLLERGDEDLGRLLQEQVTAQGSKAASAVSATLTATGAFVFETVMMLIAYFFCLVHGAELMAWLEEMTPLRRGQTRELLAEFKKVSFAVLFSTAVTSTVQAAAALIGYLLVGVPHAPFFTGLTFFAAFIPAVGAGAVCLAAALLLYLTGHPYGALFLAAWGLLIVGLVDNLIKPLLIRSGIEMNAAVVFFALIGGLAAFGGIGLLLGPLAVALFLSLLRMYQRDFRPSQAPP